MRGYWPSGKKHLLPHCRGHGTLGRCGLEQGLGAELLELPIRWWKSAGSLQAEESSETFFFSIDLKRKCPGYHTLGSSTTGFFMRKIGHLHVTQQGPDMAARPPFPPPGLCSVSRLMPPTSHTHTQSPTESRGFALPNIS